MSAHVTVVFSCDRCRAGATTPSPILDLHAVEPPEGWGSAMSKHFCPECLAKREFLVEDAATLDALNALWDAIPPAPGSEDYAAWRAEYAEPFWEFAKTVLPEQHPDYLRSWKFDRAGARFIDMELPEVPR